MEIELEGSLLAFLALDGFFFCLSVSGKESSVELNPEEILLAGSLSKLLSS
jgi:hypothetical protein